MNPSELNKLLDRVKPVVVEAGRKLKPYFGNVDFETKDGEHPAEKVVTELDRQIEEYLYEELHKITPEYGFFGEEFGQKGNQNNRWISDPIDGTAWFIRGVPLCTTMLCLIIDGEVQLALINDFVDDKLYTAVKGGGAFCNDQAIKVSNRELDDAYLAIETRIANQANVEYMRRIRETAITTNMINCGKDFIWIAEGRIDGRIMIEPWGGVWDFAPGSLLVAEAGGKVANLGKATFDYNDHNFMAVNPVVFEQLTTGDDPIFPIEK